MREKVWEAFAAELGWAPATPSTAVDPTLQSLQQVVDLGRALVTMAEQQMAHHRALTAVQQALSDHEQRLAVQEGRLDRAAQVMGETIREVRALKERLDPSNVITDEQAAELQEMIKAIAEELTRQSAGSGQRAAGSGQRAAGSGQRAAGSRRTIMPPSSVSCIGAFESRPTRI